jgi:hypothetical protein
MPETTPDDVRQRQGHTQGNPVRVLSCVVFRDSKRNELLLGVRRRTATSARHPGVLSTPTIRLPAHFFDILTPSSGRWVTSLGTTVLPRQKPFRVGVNSSLQHPEAFLVESLFARKLGLADALVAGRFEAVARAAASALDLVGDPLGTLAYEWTVMLTYEVIITRGSREIPPYSNSYSRIIWAPVDRLINAVSSKDALILDDTLDPFEVCIHGLCVRSAANLVHRER